jgi:hypothetical protein
MKRTILVVTGLLLVICLNAQTLEEIVKKYSAANKLDKMSSFSTIKLTAKTSAMGGEMIVETWMKNPNKIKVVTTVSGQEIVMVFDGEKGYMKNPMMGADVVEMDPVTAKQRIANENLFQNNLVNNYKKGQLSLEPEEKVNDKPAYKIKQTLDAGNVSYLFIDKTTYLPLKLNVTMSQQGQTFTVDSYPSNFTETNGIFLPMKTTQTVVGMGMEMVSTIEKIEVNIPMEDSIFKLK